LLTFYLSEFTEKAHSLAMVIFITTHNKTRDNMHNFLAENQNNGYLIGDFHPNGQVYEGVVFGIHGIFPN
jgi:hypothetical protein